MWCVALSSGGHNSKSREAAAAGIFMYLAKYLDGANIPLLSHALAHESGIDTYGDCILCGSRPVLKRVTWEVGPTKALRCTMQN